MIRRTILPAALFAMLVAGCTTYQPLRDTTQPGKIRKSAFTDGSKWYMMTTVIDAPFEAAFTNPGETSGVTKIKWVVEKDYLYAYKTYEEVQNVEFASANPNYMGQPVAAYKIEAHLDVWHQYNPVTGEEMPVLYESQERPWWQREWMRIDWSQNMIQASKYMSEDFCKWGGDISEDPVAYYPDQPSDPEQFYVAVKGKTDSDFGTKGFCDQDNGWCNVHGWKNIEQLKNFDYIDVVNRQFIHYNPKGAFTGDINLGCWPYPIWPIDEGIQVTQRVSFMKVPASDYQPLPYPDNTWEKFGFFRTQRDTFDYQRRITDFKTYYANRWDLWEHDTDGNGNPLPMSQRKLKPIVYYYLPTAKLDSTNYCQKSGQNCSMFLKDDLYKEIADEWNVAWRGVLKAAGYPGADTADVFEVKPIEYHCGTDGKQACENLGDLRFSFLYNHDQPSDNGLLGYGPAFTDPESGQIFSATANFYGGNLGSYYSGALGDYYDLIKGNTTDLQIQTGEDVRKYFENMGGVVGPPALPIINFTAMAKIRDEAKQGLFDPTNPTRLSFQQLELKNKLDQLKRISPRDTDRMAPFKDTYIEKMLVTPSLLSMMGEDPSEPITEQVLDRVSPLRSTSRFHQLRDNWDRFWREHTVFMGSELWDDPTDRAMVTRAENALGTDATKQDVINYILQRLFVGVSAHEVGHTFGLMHNFEGSADEQNYHPDYWKILKAHPKPVLGTVNSDGTITSTWDTNGDGILSGEEYQAYAAAMHQARIDEQNAGSELYSTSAIMDYNGVGIISSDVSGVGLYEDAALKYGYAQTIELYSNDQSKFDSSAVQAAGGWDEFKFEKRNRIDVHYFPGGQSCNTDADCPYSSEAPVAQHCRGNLGQGAILTNGQPSNLGVCSSTYFELENDAKSPATAVPYPKFMYCSDYRTGDEPFCNIFDQGSSAVDITQNLIDQYQRDYIFRNFRRYRDGFEPYFYYAHIWSRVFVPIGKFHQALLYNYYYTPGYAQNTGPGGMMDAFLASRMGLNFFAQVLATPDVGSYLKFDPNASTYDGSYTEAHAPWADAYVPLGIGKFLYSTFEQGELGQLYRYARIGTFYDKLFALEALSTRDWGLPQANDETFPINYYDAYQNEMLDLFGGIIAKDPSKYGPIITGIDNTNTVTGIEYRDLWQGDFFGTKTSDFQGLQAVQGYTTPPSQRYPGETLNAGGSIYVQIYSLLYALSDFPVFYDANFPSYVQLYRYGKTSAKDAAALANDPDVISFTSPNHGTTYATVVTKDGQALFAGLIEKAKAQSAKLVALQTIENNGGAPAGFADDPNNQICHKILGSTVTDEDCLKFLIDQEKSDVDSDESYLSLSRDMLDMGGFQTQ